MYKLFKIEYTAERVNRILSLKNLCPLILFTKQPFTNIFKKTTPILFTLLATMKLFILSFIFKFIDCLSIDIKNPKRLETYRFPKSQCTSRIAPDEEICPQLYYCVHRGNKVTPNKPLQCTDDCQGIV